MIDSKVKTTFTQNSSLSSRKGGIENGKDIKLKLCRALSPVLRRGVVVKRIQAILLRTTPPKPGTVQPLISASGIGHLVCIGRHNRRA
jgi:hypothetical protein